MKKNILLIEDNEQNRYLVTFLLERNGFEVVPAVDGTQGIGLAQSIQPTLILLDMQLPGMDGYAVAQAIRKTESLESTPIIAVTSYAMVGDREKAMAAGCNGYIEKPINPDTFVSEIHHFLPSTPEGQNNP